jgi:hypothetical protein
MLSTFPVETPESAFHRGSVTANFVRLAHFKENSVELYALSNLRQSAAEYLWPHSAPGISKRASATESAESRVQTSPSRFSSLSLVATDMLPLDQA